MKAAGLPGFSSSYSFHCSNGCPSRPSASPSNGPVGDAPGCGDVSKRRRSVQVQPPFRDVRWYVRIGRSPSVRWLTQGAPGSERSTHNTEARSSPGAISAIIQARASPRIPSHSRSASPRYRSSHEPPRSRVAKTAACPSGPSRSEPRRQLTRIVSSEVRTTAVDDTDCWLMGADPASKKTPLALTLIAPPR